MKKIISFLAIALMALSCSRPEPEPNPGAANSVKAEFKVSPESFSLKGGKGEVAGMLKEISPEGKVVKENPIAKEDFRLSLKNGDATQITIDEKEKSFTLLAGPSATFEIEAEVTQGNQKGAKQLLTVVRGGEITYTFVVTPDLFTAKGGEGKVQGKKKITDVAGATIEESVLENSDFTLTLKERKEGIKVDDATKTFVVSKGNATNFILQAVCGDGKPQILEVKREGALICKFKASNETFTAEGGKGSISAIYKATDAKGTIVEEKPLQSKEFTISLKQGNAADIVLDNETKSYTVKKGQVEANFILVAKAVFEGAVAQEIRIHRAKGSPSQQTVRMPLEYLAEYNINKTGTGLVSSNATNVSGYFTFNDAVAKFSSIAIDGKKYHLPSKEEWLAIVPESRSTPDYVSFAMEYNYNDVKETVIVAGKEITSTNDYVGNGENATYALRYKGTDLVSAWKYEYTMLDGYRVLRITARPVKGISPAVTIDEVKKPEFWENNKLADIVRILPASGWYGSLLYAEDSLGIFWSSTQFDDEKAWYMDFGKAYSVVDKHFRSNRYSVRLFQD